MATREASRFERIVVATDFSPGAAVAVERAARLPLAPRATIHVLHASPTELPRDLRAKLEREARDRLDGAVAAARRVVRETGRKDVTVAAALGGGEPFVEIIRRARTLAAELVVVGRHGHRPFRDVLLGSTAERVIRKGDIPVLLALRRPRPYTRPLVAVELTDVARPLVELAGKVADPTAKRLLVLHVHTLPFETRMRHALSPEDMAEYRRTYRDQANASLLRVVTGAPETPPLQSILRSGDARTVILREATRRRADLLVLGTHARSGVSHVLLGSVASWITRAATVDVLVGRPARFTFELP